MSSGIWLLNRQTYAQPQLGTSASSYEARGYGLQYLGLHNKPTAAVLTEAFMLTGPREEEQQETDKMS
jgi:hypothetical protein